MDNKKSSEKGFSPVKAWEAFDKINEPKEDNKKKTKYDNLIDFIDAGLTNRGRVIIYRRKALAKILTVSEMTLRNYFTRMKNDGYEIVDVVENGKNAEEIRKGHEVPSQ